MSADLGSEFPLVKAALSPSATTRQEGDDRDVSGLRAAVGEPGLPYWTFDNVNAIPADTADTAPPALGTPPPDITGPPGREPLAALRDAAPDAARFSMPGSPPPVPAQPGAAPVPDDFAAFRAPPPGAGRAAPAEDCRRMALSDMFAVLRGAAPAGRKEPTLRDMFR